MDDASHLPLSIKLPYLPRRRHCRSRIACEIDDIVSIVNILDEQNLLNSLFRYVSRNPDNTPAVRIFDGDLKFLLAWLDKMENIVDGFGKQLDVIITQIHYMPPIKAVCRCRRAINISTT